MTSHLFLLEMSDSLHRSFQGRTLHETKDTIPMVDLELDVRDGWVAWCSDSVSSSIHMNYGVACMRLPRWLVTTWGLMTPAVRIHSSFPGPWSGRRKTSMAKKIVEAKPCRACFWFYLTQNDHSAICEISTELSTTRTNIALGVLPELPDMPDCIHLFAYCLYPAKQMITVMATVFQWHPCGWEKSGTIVFSVAGAIALSLMPNH